MAHSVLVAGATGMLGSKIAHALLEKNVEVMVLTRSLHPSSPKSAQHLAQLQSRGAQVVEGDLNNMESLLKATEGAPAVISAVQGEFDIIVQGQQNLLRAAEKNTGFEIRRRRKAHGQFRFRSEPSPYDFYLRPTATILLLLAEAATVAPARRHCAGAGD